MSAASQRNRPVNPAFQAGDATEHDLRQLQASVVFALQANEQVTKLAIVTWSEAYFIGA